LDPRPWRDREQAGDYPLVWRVRVRLSAELQLVAVQPAPGGFKILLAEVLRFRSSERGEYVASVAFAVAIEAALGLGRLEADLSGELGGVVVLGLGLRFPELALRRSIFSSSEIYRSIRARARVVNDMRVWRRCDARGGVVAMPGVALL
jgi:hypothetical protein